jgi:methylamine--corrinoid protein Co-methyltransferase
VLNFLDIYERALHGPLMTENDFDMKVFIPTVRDVVNAYGVKYDPENPLPADDGAADNIYHAAVEFLSRVGVYCKDTNRVMQFTRDEILEAVEVAPGRCYLGEGKDAGIYGMRKPDDPKWPWFNVGFGWICTSEEMASNQVEALASLPEARAMKFPNLDKLRGIPIDGGSPMEIYASIRLIKIAREAMRRAGRPGMPIMSLLTSATSAATTIAASAPQFGLRPTDEWICGFTAEMKIDFNTLNKVAYLQNWGANIGAESAPILGGYCGGPAGTAIVNTAYFLAGLLVQRSTDHLTFPTHFRYGCTTTKDILWVVSSACQASSRNIPVPVHWSCYLAAGPNTKMYYCESAAYLLCAVTSGSAGTGTPHPATGVKIDGATPMDAEFGIEISKAASKLTRDQASEIVLRLLEKYETRIPAAPKGDRYQDCYDAVNGKPSESCLRRYNEVVEELIGIGIPFE